MRFLSDTGTVQWYWSTEDRNKFHTFHEVRDIMMPQMEEEIDYNNLIITFPGRHGSNSSIFTREDMPTISIDHASYVVDVCLVLNEMGIKWKDGTSIDYNKNGWDVCPAGIVIQDGVARIINNANPFGSSKGYFRSDKNPEIKWDKEDEKNITLDDKNIIFSGFLVEIARAEKLIDRSIF